MIKKIIIRTILTIIIIPVLYIAYLTTVILIENKQNTNNSNTSNTNSSTAKIETPSDVTTKSPLNVETEKDEDAWPEVDPFAKLRDMQKEEKKNGHSIRIKTFNLLKEEKYDQLEELAKRYREDKETFATQTWKLNYLYDGLSLYKLAFGEDNHAPRDPRWVIVINRIKKWIENKPDSITARIALTETWIGYAFAARGHHFAKDVTETQWLIFYERIENAEKTLLEAINLEAKCPHLWVTSLILNRLSASPETNAYDIFQEAIAFEPEYTAYYKKMASTLLPRWGGSAEKWKDFIETSANNIGGAKGDMLYTSLMWLYYKKTYKDELNLEKAVDVDRIARGVEAILSLQ